MADRPPLRVPEATAQHAVGTRRTTSRSAPSLTDAFCDTCGVIAGPLRDDAAAAWVWGHLAAGPPTSLPAVLSSVEDVARVAAAASMSQVRERTWFANPQITVAVTETGIEIDSLPLVLDAQFPATTALVWQAIQAARGGEPG